MKIGEIASISQALEPLVTPKPGNVHRFKDLPRMTLSQMLKSSIISLKYYVEAAKIGARLYVENKYEKGCIGRVLEGCIRENVEFLGGNVSLGLTLNLTLQSAASTYTVLECGRFDVDKLVEVGKRIVYLTDGIDALYYLKAVKHASPSYLGRISYWGVPDVYDPLLKLKVETTNLTLYKLLSTLSSDVVSKNFTSGLQITRAYYKLYKEYSERLNWNDALLRIHARLIVDFRDYLVFRKHGVSGVLEAEEMVKNCLSLEDPSRFLECIEGVDEQFRIKGYNPGSTADIVATVIMCSLLEGLSPWRPWR